MIIKKFIANNINEALTRAKYELGSDAMIVSQREIKVGKWFNPFKKKMLEITVALEDKPVPAKTEEPKEVVKPIVQDKEKITDLTVPMAKTEQVKEFEDEEVSMDVDPFFTYAGDDVRKRLKSYCMLHNKDDFILSAKERHEFLGIVLKESPFGRGKNLSRINVLVGPTGVGKTTTIAKLAASQQLGDRRKVGLITMDTYRIGAVQQLKTYAEILSVPFHVVNNPSEMKEKIDMMTDCDIILVDTLGTSPRDMGKLVEIKKNLNAMGEGVSTYLVMSMSTDKDSMESIIERYKLLKYDAMVLTKVDEVENTRNLWYLIEKNFVPIQYFCHGQDVPDDIKEATPENIFNYFEESFDYDRSSWKTKRNYS